MNIVDDVATCIPDGSTHSTALTSLKLEECNICTGGLFAILSLPKGLDQLYLGENAHNYGHFTAPVPLESNALFQRKPGRTMQALNQQQHALRILTYAAAYSTTGMHMQRPHGLVDTDGAFADFQKLQDVTLIGRSPTFERCLMSGRSPPNLVRLAAKDFNHHVDKDGMMEIYHAASEVADRLWAMDPFLRVTHANIPMTLRRLDHHYDQWFASISKNALRDEATNSAAVVPRPDPDHIIRRIYSPDEVGPSQYYPPFLYGETEPIAALWSEQDMGPPGGPREAGQCWIAP